MAVAWTHKLADAVLAAASTSRVTAGTYTPTANALQVCTVTTEGGSMTVSPSLSGAGLTWVLVNEVRMFNQATRGFYTFRALGTGSAGALTFTAGGTDTFDSIVILVDEGVGVDTSGTNGSGAVVQTVVANSQETLTPTVAITMAAGNEGFAAFAINDTSRTGTPKTGWTELGDHLLSGRCAAETQYRQSVDTSASVTWSGAGTPVCAAIVWEIKPAAGGYTLIADAGAFAIAGTDAALRHDRLVTAGAGAFVIAGTDATLTYNANGQTFTLTADAGAFAIAGTVASLRAGRLVTADAGSYALAGTDAGLFRTLQLEAEPGAVTISGQLAALRLARRLAAAAGSFAIAGQDATLDYSGFVLLAVRGTDHSAPLARATDLSAALVRAVDRSLPSASASEESP